MIESLSKNFHGRISPEFDQWSESLSNHNGGLSDAAISIVVPVAMYDEVQAFVEEPSQIASMADEWLRGRR